MLSLTSIVGFTSCAPSQPGTIRVVGAVWAVSHDDIDDAIAEDRSGARIPNQKIAYIHIVNRNKMEIYHSFAADYWDEVERVKGKWTFTGTAGILW